MSNKQRGGKVSEPVKAVVAGKEGRKARRRAKNDEAWARNRELIRQGHPDERFPTKTARRKWLDDEHAAEKRLVRTLADVQPVSVVGLPVSLAKIPAVEIPKPHSRTWLLEMCEEMGIKTTSKSTIAQMEAAIALKKFGGE